MEESIALFLLMETANLLWVFPDLEMLILNVWYKMSPVLFRCNCQPKVGAWCEERSRHTGKCRHHRYWHPKVSTTGMLCKWREKGKDDKQCEIQSVQASKPTSNLKFQSRFRSEALWRHARWSKPATVSYCVLGWCLVTSKHRQRADTAKSTFYLCKLGQIIRISCHLHQSFQSHLEFLLQFCCM